MSMRSPPSEIAILALAVRGAAHRYRDSFAAREADRRGHVLGVRGLEHRARSRL
jgi:hypothetical protein